MYFRECSINGIKYQELNGRLVPEGMMEDTLDGSNATLVTASLALNTFYSWDSTHKVHFCFLSIYVTHPPVVSQSTSYHSSWFPLSISLTHIYIQLYQDAFTFRTRWFPYA